MKDAVQAERILEENKRLREQLEESRMTLAASQIQPHFIYNTLEAVRVLIRTSPDEAYQMVYDFSKYLRANLDALGGQPQILFSKEMEHIEAYINIERVRFEERLQVIFDIEEDAFCVPPLCVQVVVENAVKHGVYGRMEGGCVWIRSYKGEGCYIVEVEDNGVGFEDAKKNEDSVPHTSVGLSNIRFRLKKISNAEMTIESRKNVGTKVVMTFPDMAE